MADRTHSHDTSTPAMSDETVPSEEFVLVPREPTPAMQRAYFDSIDTNMHRVENDVRFGRYENMRTAYRAMIAAAPTLSASHLAKEGGEAGVASPPAKLAHRIVLHCQNTPPEEAIEIAERLIVTALNHPMNVPQPSPALAKGGDAVREAFRAGWKVNAVGTDVHPQEYLDGCEEVDWEDYAARAALSNPTEGPASQTEGMGGDALDLKALNSALKAWDECPDYALPSTLIEKAAILAEAVRAALAIPTGKPAPKLYAEEMLDEIEAMLDGDQGDDDGLQIMPDYPEGADVASKVAACIALLERRRDIVEAVEASAGGISRTAVMWAYDQLLEHIDRHHRLEELSPEGQSLMDVVNHLSGTLIAAALTPPETAEAVPVAWRWRMAADRVWNYQEDRQRIPDAIHEALYARPAPATDDRVEAVAAAMWKEEAREATPRGVWEARTLEAFRETDDGNRYRWKRFARAALATEASR